MNKKEESGRHTVKYYCNPLNIDYRYQFNADPRNDGIQIAREAADPSMICFQGRYYIFASMQLSVWVSDDLVHWESRRLPENLPLYDYAPDARVIGEYVYVCASKRGEICNYYRTKDILNGPYEEIKGTFDFWDPNLFCDDDGRVYFYWGCSNMTPVWGVELDPHTMKPVCEKVSLIEGDAWTKGFERVGENNSKMPKTEEEVELAFEEFMKHQPDVQQDMTPYIPLIKGMFSDKPYIEGPWMEKYQGRYYLQYAFAGTEYNTYGDAVMEGDSPLGPFHLAKNSPFSYKPGGFIPGAGHGSTMWDQAGNFWHTSTMRISINHKFERRVGLWPAGYDRDGELFCNQRYGDWPMAVTEGEMDPWRDPEWYLLSVGKCADASSYEEGKEPGKALEENVQTWWRAATNEPGEWLCADLGQAYKIHAVQVNFADDRLDIPVPGQIRGTTQARYIDETIYPTRWKLEGSVDGEAYFIIEDKSQAETDLPHDLIVSEEGYQARYIRLTVYAVPYDQPACISGLRVFGKGDGPVPAVPDYTVERVGDLDMKVVITERSGMADIPDTSGETDAAGVALDIAGTKYAPASGYNILWGSSPEKLYHSRMTFDTECVIGALVKGESYYLRVDAFNENGITEGFTKKL